MYFAMNYKVTIGEYRLQMLESVKIMKSVETLADTAVITIPGAHINRTLEVEDKIREGDAVEIWLGYDDELKLEFKGYLNRIATNDNSINLECEDALFLFRKSLQNVQLEQISLTDLLLHVISEVNTLNANAGTPTNYQLSCSYEFTWDKFTIFQDTAHGVLKVVQRELRANVYFDGETLNVHPPYRQVKNDVAVAYDFGVNIEKSELEYMRAADKNMQVEVTAITPKGETRTQHFGNNGGTVERVRSGSSDPEDMQRVAENIHNVFVYDGFEGNFTGWLIPYVEPSYKISLRDTDYPQRDGEYYVIATEVNFGENGGERKVILGQKLN